MVNFLSIVCSKNIRKYEFKHNLLKYTKMVYFLKHRS